MAHYTIVNLPNNRYGIDNAGTTVRVVTVTGFKQAIRVATDLEIKARRARK